MQCICYLYPVLNNCWLVTGGAGYIGAHVVSELSRLGVPNIALDNNRDKIERRLPASNLNFCGDIRNRQDLESVFSRNEFHGVIHLAALKSVQESQIQSDLYEETNVLGTQNVLSLMKEHEVKNLIFSSTAAIYEENESGFVTEFSKLNPVSFYGQTKVRAELSIEKAKLEFGLRYVNLRFFNVAGTINQRLKDDSKDNLIPIVIDCIKKGITPKIFGGDYPTKDGTAIRDYIHISDIVQAHIASIGYLNNGGSSEAINLGTGKGTTVLEIVSEILNKTGSNLVPQFVDRRPGDSGVVVADPSKAELILGFKAQHTLEEMISSVL